MKKKIKIKRKTNRRTMTIRLPVEIIDKIKNIAKKNKQSQSNIVSQSIEFLEENLDENN